MAFEGRYYDPMEAENLDLMPEIELRVRFQKGRKDHERKRDPRSE